MCFRRRKGPLDQHGRVGLPAGAPHPPGGRPEVPLKERGNALLARPPGEGLLPNLQEVQAAPGVPPGGQKEGGRLRPAGGLHRQGQPLLPEEGHQGRRVSLTDIADHKSYFRDMFPHSCSPALLAQASQDY